VPGSATSPDLAGSKTEFAKESAAQFSDAGARLQYFNLLGVAVLVNAHPCQRQNPRPDRDPSSPRSRTVCRSNALTSVCGPALAEMSGSNTSSCLPAGPPLRDQYSRSSFGSLAGPSRNAQSN